MEGGATPLTGSKRMQSFHLHHLQHQHAALINRPALKINRLKEVNKMDLSNKTIEKLLHEQLLKLPLNNTTTIFNESFSKKTSGRWFK